MGPQKNILFRVDAGAEVGLGHFYRSLNLAKALKKLGHRILFTHKPSIFWLDRVNAGFEFENLQLSSEENIIHQERIIKDFNIEIFYVDGFIDFSESEILSFKALGVTIVFYQNLTQSRIFSDIFILPSIHQGNSFFDKFSNNTNIYRGLIYFTFSEKILSLPKKKYRL